MSLTMDDRDGFIWLDGKLVPWRDGRVHVLTHALHYGSAVFEGERIYDGRVFRLAAHSARLINSARLLDYEMPWTRAEIEEATRAVVKANGLQAGYVRPIAWRGSEVLGVSGIGTTVHLAIAPWAQEGRLSVQARDSGINVTMAKYRRPSADFAPGHAKVAGLYIICGIEKDRALKAGFDDALMLDWKGDLAKSTGANIFLVIDGKLVTPDAGELPRRHHAPRRDGPGRKTRLGGRGAHGAAGGAGRGQRGIPLRHGCRDRAGGLDRRPQLPGRPVRPHA